MEKLATRMDVVYDVLKIDASKHKKAYKDLDIMIMDEPSYHYNDYTLFGNYVIKKLVQLGYKKIPTSTVRGAITRLYRLYVVFACRNVNRDKVNILYAERYSTDDDDSIDRTFNDVPEPPFNLVLDKLHLSRSAIDFLYCIECHHYAKNTEKYTYDKEYDEYYSTVLGFLVMDFDRVYSSTDELCTTI